MKNVVVFSNVYKRYRKNMNSFKAIFGYLFDIPSVDDFWALKNVTLTLKKGDILGIIGLNGAGKSTILKILANVTQPTKGKVAIDGKVGALIEIGAGLHPELTGSENIFLYGSILGMKRQEVKDKYNEIVKFSELKDFLNTPVKFYSSGMYLKLGFSVTVHTEPDILLIDEVLAVGDESFQGKCFEKMGQFKKADKTIVFVSHNLYQIEYMCKRAIWLDKGKIKALGNSKSVVNMYRLHLDKEEEKAPKENNGRNLKKRRQGTGEARITEVKILDGKEKQKHLFKAGEEMIVRIKIKFYKDIKDPIFGFIIYDINGNKIYGTNTRWRGMKLGEFKKHSMVYFSSRQKIDLLGGRYFLNVAVAYSDALRYYDRKEKAATFRIIRTPTSIGIADLRPQLSISVNKN